MPIKDFDVGVLTRVYNIYPSPSIEVVYMQDELFERRRITYKQENKEVFPFISVFRTPGWRFDTNRWDPSKMFWKTIGHYNDDTRTSTTLYNIFPVIFDYVITFWDTRREYIDIRTAQYLKNLYLSPIINVSASETEAHLDMRCYMDFDYKMVISDDAILEREDKVPYFKSKHNFGLEGWLFDYEADGGVIQHVHAMYYNKEGQLLEHQWIPDAESGWSGQSGESGI